MTDLVVPDPVPFLLVLARVGGLVMSAPVLGHLLVPLRVRIGLAFILAAALAPAVAAEAPTSAWALGGAIVVESVVGVLLGFVAQLVFAGVQLGGELAGVHMGFGLVHLIDPQSQQSLTIISQWQALLALLLFLVIDAHHLLVRALLASFEAAPPGVLALAGIAFGGVIALAGDLFVIGVRIAAPVLIVLLLTNAALGVLARTIPQLNVFIVGFPLNVGVGLLMLGASLPFTFRLLTSRFTALEPTLGALVRSFAHG